MPFIVFNIDRNQQEIQISKKIRSKRYYARINRRLFYGIGED
ncbi:MAG: hypothetical protein PWQ09_535 [Candidatus Cloacimonadota bacterium]|nr:hypothetical protein [Candidatus Cloacimonadota bacterium]